MTMLPDTTAVRLERRHSRLYVTLDDPATRNALSETMLTDLEQVIAATGDDRSLRALVLQGHDGRFCAGGNLKGGSWQGVGAGPDPVQEESARGGRLFHALYRHPLVVIALIDGAAMGGGFGLACCADIVVTTPRARFALSETSLGLVPAQIAPMVVARIGLAAARRLALTGRRIDGPEARKIGLSDQHCDSLAQAEDVVEALLQDVGRCGAEANAATKRLFIDMAGEAQDAQIARAARVFTASLRGDEGREGIAAFVEKRRPTWAEPV